MNPEVGQKEGEVMGQDEEKGTPARSKKRAKCEAVQEREGKAASQEVSGELIPAELPERMPEGIKWKYATEEEVAMCQAIVLDRLSRAEKGLPSILEEVRGPNPATWFRWCERSEPLRDRSARAREAQATFLASRVVELGHAALTLPKDSVAGYRLACDSYRWAAARLNPALWGDRIVHTGADGKSDPSFTISMAAPKGGSAS